MSTILISEPPAPGAKRDALHVAVVPVIACQDLEPSTPVKIRGQFASKCPKEESVGIVSPFIAGTVLAGQPVWVMMNPGTINALRHDWSHPDLPSEYDKAVEEARLKGYDEGFDEGSNNNECAGCYG